MIIKFGFGVHVGIVGMLLHTHMEQHVIEFVFLSPGPHL